jgi:hypothetical protein
MKREVGGDHHQIEVRISAPKGRNKSAQGNALGTHAVSHFSSPVRAKQEPASSVVLPFQGGNLPTMPFPRALPWADLLQPFRLRCWVNDHFLSGIGKGGGAAPFVSSFFTYSATG